MRLAASNKLNIHVYSIPIIDKNWQRTCSPRKSDRLEKVADLYVDIEQIGPD